MSRTVGQRTVHPRRVLAKLTEMDVVKLRKSGRSVVQKSNGTVSVGGRMFQVIQLHQAPTFRKRTSVSADPSLRKWVGKKARSVAGALGELKDGLKGESR